MEKNIFLIRRIFLSLFTLMILVSFMGMNILSLVASLFMLSMMIFHIYMEARGKRFFADFYHVFIFWTSIFYGFFNSFFLMIAAQVSTYGAKKMLDTDGLLRIASVILPAFIFVDVLRLQDIMLAAALSFLTYLVMNLSRYFQRKSVPRILKNY